MMDPILESRIEALQQSLLRAEDSVDFIQGFDEWITKIVHLVQQAGNNDKLIAGFDERVGVPRDLWKKARLSFRERMNEYDSQLNELLESLRSGPGEQDPDEFLRNAWSTFVDIQRRSRDLFADCLEFIGGVSFRDRSTEKLWRIADELAREAADDLFGESWSFLTVPSLEEKLSDNLARTLRLRFPEWTIWNLPLLLHEFGHVAITNKPRLSKLLDEQITELVGEDEEGRKPEATPQRQARREEQARRRHATFVRPLLADAFAVYTAGPAYACAAFHLRFDPGLAATGTPSYAERAAIVLGCLRQIDRNEYMKALIDQLKGQWTAAVERSGMTDQASSTRLERVEHVLLPAFLATLDDMSATPWYRPKNWLDAMKWKDDWADRLEHGRQLCIDTLEPTYKLRDVLNAAWLARMQAPEMVEALTRTAPQMCVALIKLKREAESEQRGRFTSSPFQRAESGTGGLRV
jgi:hypothetical protein